MKIFKIDSINDFIKIANLLFEKGFDTEFDEQPFLESDEEFFRLFNIHDDDVKYFYKIINLDINKDIDNYQQSFNEFVKQTVAVAPCMIVIENNPKKLTIVKEFARCF